MRNEVVLVLVADGIGNELRVPVRECLVSRMRAFECTHADAASVHGAALREAGCGEMRDGAALAVPGDRQARAGRGGHLPGNGCRDFRPQAVERGEKALMHESGKLVARDEHRFEVVHPVVQRLLVIRRARRQRAAKREDDPARSGADERGIDQLIACHESRDRLQQTAADIERREFRHLSRDLDGIGQIACANHLLIDNRHDFLP